MKILKRIFIGIIVLVALALIVALFVKKDFASVREITINKPRQEVFDYVKHIKNQNEFGVWSKMDPNMKKEYRGTDGTEGFIYAWEGNSDVGKGEQKIVKITEGQRVDLDLHFIEPFESSSPAYFTTEEVSPTQTKVRWGISGKMVYPFNLVSLFMNMDEALGKDFETGLNNMKNILEK